MRIIGLPRSGEVRFEGRKVALGEAFSVDHFMTGTFKPDGTMLGPIGTLDLLVEDGRGGSVIGSLPIAVLSAGQLRVVGDHAPPAVLQAPAPVSVGTEPDAAKPVITPFSPAPPSPTAQFVGGSSFADISVARASPVQPSSAHSLDAPSGLAEARILALGVPCALIDVWEAQSPSQPAHLLVSGPALPGAAFNSFIRQIEVPGHPVGVATEPLDPGHCDALAVMTDLVRRTREQRALRL